jgi:hypothetical protein
MIAFDEHKLSSTLAAITSLIVFSLVDTRLHDHYEELGRAVLIRWPRIEVTFPKGMPGATQRVWLF